VAPEATDQGRPAGQREKSQARRGGLGRGLGALIPTSSVSEAAEPASLEVPIDAIVPNPYQPRTNPRPEQLQELAASLRTHGVIQPLIVKRADGPDRYVLIAGERRWRAAKLAGLATVPVVVKDAAPQAMLELALVENVVRADLSPLEEATAYRQLIEEFGLTQASVAERVGRSRVTITNTLRLLSAPEPIQAALNDGRISEGHARALLGLPNAADQVALLQVVLERDYTVRQTEEAVRRWLAGGEQRRDGAAERDPDVIRLEDRFRGALQTKVTLHRNRGRAGGTLTIHYYSDEELSGLYRRLVGEDDW
jgi:ParB family chromosome partitioning protein